MVICGLAPRWCKLDIIYDIICVTKQTNNQANKLIDYMTPGGAILHRWCKQNEWLIYLKDLMIYCVVRMNIDNA